jgi:hypothetical protein
MARTPSRASAIAHSIEGLVHAITGLVDQVAGAAQEAKAVGRAAEGVKVAVVGAKKRGPGKGNPKLKAALKRYWAKMKGKARAARVARMLKGRGLKPKAKPVRRKAEKAAPASIPAPAAT